MRLQAQGNPSNEFEKIGTWAKVNDVQYLGLMQRHPSVPHLPVPVLVSNKSSPSLTNILKAKTDNKISKHVKTLQIQTKHSSQRQHKVTSLIQPEIADLLGIGIAPTSNSHSNCRWTLWDILVSDALYFLVSRFRSFSASSTDSSPESSSESEPQPKTHHWSCYLKAKSKKWPVAFQAWLLSQCIFWHTEQVTVKTISVRL